MRRARGFTAVELAVVVSISAILVPLMFVFARQLETTARIAQWHLDNAAGVQRVAEALRQDARSGPREGDQLAWGGPCAVRYVVTQSFALERQAAESCGGKQVLATGVRAITPVSGGVELSFVLALSEQQSRKTEVFFPVEAR
jgi:prepilin-type N-terminal cleavage/methylation domain-containing protein